MEKISKIEKELVELPDAECSATGKCSYNTPHTSEKEKAEKGFSADCVTLGCIDINECITGKCPYLEK